VSSAACQARAVTVAVKSTPARARTAPVGPVPLVSDGTSTSSPKGRTTKGAVPPATISSPEPAGGSPTPLSSRACSWIRPASA